MTNRDLLIDFLGWYQRNTQMEGTENEKWMDEATVDSYLNQPNGSNMVLAVSGLPSTSIEEVIKTLDLAQCEIRAFYKRFNYQDSNVLRQIDSVHEALKAACASGAVGKTVSDGCNHLDTEKLYDDVYRCKTCDTLIYP